MPADLCVAPAHGGTLLVAAGFQHGVFAVLVLDAQHGLLEFFLPFQLLGVGEKVHLIEALVRRDLVGVEGDAPHRQCRVGDTLKQLCAFVDEGAAQIGGRIKPDSAVSCLGDEMCIRDRSLPAPQSLPGCRTSRGFRCSASEKVPPSDIF